MLSSVTISEAIAPGPLLARLDYISSFLAGLESLHLGSALLESLYLKWSVSHRMVKDGVYRTLDHIEPSLPFSPWLDFPAFMTALVQV